MAIKGYRQVIDVTEASTLPMTAMEGDMAFADDDKHYYVFREGTWVKIPTQPEVQEFKVVSAQGGVVTQKINSLRFDLESGITFPAGSRLAVYAA